MKTIAIIGGGAAGLAASIVAAQESQGNDVRVVIYEASDRVGKSILATGNGRCNFSNAHVSPDRYYNAAFVQDAFETLPPKDVLDWFARLGMIWSEEAEGRLYPTTFRANTVLEVLRLAAKDLGIVEKVNNEVHAVTPVQSHFLITLADSRAEWADEVIVACGHHIARSLIPPAHRFENTDPILCPLRTDESSVKGLDTVRIRARVSLGDYYQEEGEVLFRVYGVSGIVIFNMSRFARKGDALILDLLPSMSADQIIDYVDDLHNCYPGRTLFDLFTGLLDVRVIEAIRHKAGLGDEAVNKASIKTFVEVLKSFKLEVLGKGDPKQAQVFRGGFDVQGFDPHTMRSLSVPGLYLVGEALDVDGPCGGYNLHWAWTSGIIAGHAAAQKE